MKISEIFLVVFVLALLTGAYFFIQRKFINPPAKRFETFKLPETNTEQLQMDYYEKNKEKMDAIDEHKIKKMQKEMKTVEPYIKQAEDYYQKEYGYISKLPPKQQEKELKKLVEKKQKETEKYKKYLPR